MRDAPASHRIARTTAAARIERLAMSGLHTIRGEAQRRQTCFQDTVAPREYHSSMDSRILVGTGSGLWVVEGETAKSLEAFAGRSVTALALDAASRWAIVDGSALWEWRGDV